MEGRVMIVVKTFAILLGTILQSATLLQAQQQPVSLVTFVTSGGFWEGSGRTAETLGINSGKIAAEGILFDGDQRLGFLQWDHWVTFSVPAGHHVFSANVERGKPGTKDIAAMDLRPGQQAFVELTTTAKGVSFVLTFRSAHLRSVTCADAALDAKGAKPVEEKRVNKASRKQWVQLTTFPECANANQP